MRLGREEQTGETSNMLKRITEKKRIMRRYKLWEMIGIKVALFSLNDRVSDYEGERPRTY